MHAVGAAAALFLAAVAGAQGAGWAVVADFPGGQFPGSFGEVVGSAGDLNGDGKPEVFGVVRSVSASGTNRVVLQTFGQSAPLRVLSGPTADRFGEAVAMIGDADLDGVPDLAVGSPQPTSAFTIFAGFTRIYSGADGSVISTIFGVLPGSECGASIAPAGDLDGDGCQDLWVGSPGGTNSLSPFGSVAAYSGDSGQLIGMATYGSQALDRYGATLAALGDVDADGVGDLVVGAPHFAGGLGRAYVRSGANGALIEVLDAPAGAALFADGLAALGDVDGDGIGDFAVRAPGVGSFGVQGRAFVYSGATRAILFAYYDSDGGSGYGAHVAAALDWDADGRNDFVLGSASSGDVAVARVALGATGGIEAIISGESLDAAGSARIAADALGDFDGDGRSDLVIGFPGNDLGGPNVGRLRVVSRPASAMHASGAPSAPSIAQGAAGSSRGGPYNLLKLNGSSGGSSRAVQAPIGGDITLSLEPTPWVAVPADYIIGLYGGFAAPTPYLIPGVGIVGLPIGEPLVVLASTFGGAGLVPSAVGGFVLTVPGPSAPGLVVTALALTTGASGALEPTNAVTLVF